MKPKWKKRLQILLISLVVVLIVVVGGFWIYTQDYYRAEQPAQQAMAEPQGKVEALENMWVFHSEQENESDKALIFYPGGKVEATAYAPLLQKLAQKGITCVLMKMPFNLAVLDMNAADRAFKQLSQVKEWYIGGHSLGGAMAGSYASAHTDKLKGLILLGAYSAKPVDLPTLAVYGSEDKVLDRSKLKNMPNCIEIAGGNHAYFGNYGEQKGDGKATISKEEQQSQTVEAIVKFILGGS